MTPEIIQKYKIKKSIPIELVKEVDNSISFDEYKEKFHIEVDRLAPINPNTISVGDIISTLNYGDFEVIEMLEPRRTYYPD